MAGKKHLIWLGVALFIQTGVLYAFNSYFHVPDVTTPAALPAISATSVPTDDVANDNGAVRLVGTSFDKQYYAVAYNKRIEVYKLEEKKPVFGVDVPDGMYVSVMHWLPDETRFLYALANSSRAKSGRVEVHVVNVSSGDDMLVKDLNHLRRGSHVKKFALSTLTNLLYLDIEDRRKNDSIYQINIMKRMRRFSLPSDKIDNMVLASKEDLLYYEDSVRKQVLSYNGRRIKMITPDDWDYCLLGISKDDMLYIGRLNDGKITSIFKTDQDGKLNLFADLAHEIPKENVLQGLNGQLVIKNFPSDNYVEIIRPTGETKTFSIVDPKGFITGDAMFYSENGLMHITFLE